MSVLWVPVVVEFIIIIVLALLVCYLRNDRDIARADVAILKLAIKELMEANRNLQQSAEKLLRSRKP